VVASQQHWYCEQVLAGQKRDNRRGGPLLAGHRHSVGSHRRSVVGEDRRVREPCYCRTCGRSPAGHRCGGVSPRPVQVLAHRARVQPLAELVGFGGVILPFGSDDGVEPSVVTSRSATLPRQGSWLDCRHQAQGMDGGR
jgi:hypothetical protein